MNLVREIFIRVLILVNALMGNKNRNSRAPLKQLTNLFKEFTDNEKGGKRNSAEIKARS